MANRELVIERLGVDLNSVDLGAPDVVCREERFERTFDELRFNASHGQIVRGYFLHPSTPNSPAILYCHAHGGRYDIGMSELVDGRPALTSPYLGELAQAGYAVLCLEMPTFGSRSIPNESTLSKSLLWNGKTLFGMMLAELSAGISFLQSQAQIDPTRIGTMGISMGGTHAWWLSALDARIKAAASMCCFADLERLVETGTHDGHGHYMTVPGLLTDTSTGALAGLAAPRAQLHCVGLADVFTPEPAFRKAQAELQDCYRSRPENLQFFEDTQTGHTETTAMRKAVMAFLQGHL